MTGLAELDREAVEQLAIALMIPVRNTTCADRKASIACLKCSMRLRPGGIGALGADGEGGEGRAILSIALRNQLAAGL